LRRNLDGGHALRRGDAGLNGIAGQVVKLADGRLEVEADPQGGVRSSARADLPGSTGGVPNRNNYFDGDDMFIADDWVTTYSRQQGSTAGTGEAGTFMHELGHTLGLVPAGCRPTPFGGIDEPLTDPGDPNYDPALYANYTSIMNYHYQMIGPVDYSDGSHGTDPYGNPDFDDWSATNISRIWSDWNVYEG